MFESALIVLSVLLGFAMSEWRQRQGEREVASVALANFHREITDNLATLERVQSKHAG